MCSVILTDALSVQDNDLEREFAVHRTSHDYASEEFWKWALSIIIGATMGALAFLVDWGIDILNTSKYTAVNAKIYGAGGLGMQGAKRDYRVFMPRMTH